MKLGMVGLPNVGKSTLFNALTNAGAESANYPFCTIEPNVGIVSVPDKRLDRLAEIYNPEKFTPATLEFVDIAGLVKGASKGEGLGNKFLADIREVDALIHVVRCFDNDSVVHVDGSVNAERDIETINLELIFADLEILTRRLDKAKKMLKGDKGVQKEIDLIEALIKHLENGDNARSYPLTENEDAILKTTPLLSKKPVIYACNLAENDFNASGGVENNANYTAVKKFAEKEKSACLPICAQIEAEISEMDKADREEFLLELGLSEAGLERVIKEGYSLLGLISFLTAGPQEVRAWTIEKGTKAPKAAGKIHTDFEKGFIKAEVVKFDDLSRYGSIAAAKEKGLVRLEGKDYVMKDGDVVLFRFNV